MNRLYGLVLLLVACVSTSFSQTTANCTQVLRLMQTIYEQGRLHELPNLADGCLNAAEGKGFTKEEKREAYRILTLAYIYLEEPEKADESMLKLLETAHFYEVNQSVDPAEFVVLYNKFRHDPLFRYGLKVGGNMTFPSATQYQNVGSTAGGQGTYNISGSIQIMAMFEKDFPKIHKMLVLAPEIGWVSRSYGYENPNLGVGDGGTVGTGAISNQVFAIKQSWLDLNAIVQYKLENTIQRQLYVGLGPGASMLLSSSNQATTDIGTGAQKYSVTGPSVDDKESYNKFVFSVTALVGAKLKVGELYLNADVRYQYGLNNVVNGATRTNPEIAFDYWGQYNDYRMSNFMVHIGALIPHFSPKKLIK